MAMLSPFCSLRKGLFAARDCVSAAAFVSVLSARVRARRSRTVSLYKNIMTSPAQQTVLWQRHLLQPCQSVELMTREWPSVHQLVDGVLRCHLMCVRRLRGICVKMVIGCRESFVWQKLISCMGGQTQIVEQTICANALRSIGC